jgi:hypothetical protein
MYCRASETVAVADRHVMCAKKQAILQYTHSWTDDCFRSHDRREIREYALQPTDRLRRTKTDAQPLQTVSAVARKLDECAIVNRIRKSATTPS